MAGVESEALRKVNLRHSFELNTFNLLMNYQKRNHQRERNIIFFNEMLVKVRILRATKKELI